jgi:hypothetical protein
MTSDQRRSRERSEVKGEGGVEEWRVEECGGIYYACESM